MIVLYSRKYIFMFINFCNNIHINKNFKLIDFNKMINYNSCIDSYSSRSQLSPLSYSALKKPTKVKPKIRYFHEFLLKADEFVPPVFSTKKPLSLSPRRISQNFKFPNQTPKRSSLIPTENSKNKFYTLSVEFPTVPKVSSKHKQLPSINPILYYNPSIIRESSQVYFLNKNTEKNSKSLLRNSSQYSNSSIYSTLANFLAYIEQFYKKTYEEIDIAQKGFITLDDFINLVMFIDLISANSKENFEIVKSKAENIFNMFLRVSSSNKVTKKDFYAVCSVFEHVKGKSDSFDLMNEDVCAMITKKTEEIRLVFGFYAKNGRIK